MLKNAPWRIPTVLGEKFRNINQQIKIVVQQFSVKFYIRNIVARKMYNINFTASNHPQNFIYEGWNFNSGNYLFTTDTK